MKCLVKQKEAFTATAWSGGTTTELFLYPEGASYAERNFAVRASTSTVDKETSTFTDLPGYERLLMSLDRRIRLVHNGAAEVELAPFDVDRFAGGWNTRSFGRCTDFNLMLASGWQGSLAAVRAPGRYECAGGGFTGLFSLADGVVVSAVEKADTFRAALGRGGLLLVEGGDAVELSAGAGPPSAVLFRAARAL